MKETEKMIHSLIRRRWLTLILIAMTLALAYWTFDAYQRLGSILQLL